MKSIWKLSKEEEQRSLNIHKKAIVINALDGMFSTSHGWTAFNKAHIEKLKKGGYTCLNLTTRSYQPPTYEEQSDFKFTAKTIGEWYSLFRGFDEISLVTTTQQIEEAKRNGKIGVIFGFQNGSPIESKLDFVEVFYKLGVRIMQLTYQKRNMIGDGCGEKTSCGLSKFGREVIPEMNRVGMIVDLSHAGPTTAMEAAELSKDPVIFSHSNVRSLCDSVRNIDDCEIKAMAEKNGVMGITANSMFLKRGVPRATIEDYLDHIDYVVKLAGVNHVGLGLDIMIGYRTKYYSKEDYETYTSSYPEVTGGWTYEAIWAEGIDDHSLCPNITRGLVSRGYSVQEIEKILGGNFLRVFKKVWK